MTKHEITKRGSSGGLQTGQRVEVCVRPSEGELEGREYKLEILSRRGPSVLPVAIFRGGEEWRALRLSFAYRLGELLGVFTGIVLGGAGVLMLLYLFLSLFGNGHGA